MGLKITDKRTAYPVEQRAVEIPTGQLFEGRIPSGIGVFLKTLQRIVMLSPDPNSWACDELGIIKDYRPVNAELVITD